MSTCSALTNVSGGAGTLLLQWVIFSKLAISVMTFTGPWENDLECLVLIKFQSLESWDWDCQVSPENTCGVRHASVLIPGLTGGLQM